MASNQNPLESGSPAAASGPGRGSILVSLATAPLLMGLLVSRTFESLIQEVGQASEELFRGERLPVLPLGTSALTESDRSSDSQANEASTRLN